MRVLRKPNIPITGIIAFAVLFAFLLYIIPHMLQYNELNNLIKKVEPNAEFTFGDYYKILASAGSSIGRTGRSSSLELGSFGFYALELLNFVIMFGAIYYMADKNIFKRGTVSGTQKHNKLATKHRKNK